jgi:uncharacterized protein (DUF2141 family)
MVMRFPIFCTIFLTLGAFLTALPKPSQAAPEPACLGEPSATRLNVVVENVRNAHGLMAVTLYPDDPNRFLVHHGSLFVARVPAHAPVTRLCLFVPHPGAYGVAVYHDEDGNHKLTRNLGLPAEGFGFSNNPATPMGLPRFSEVRMPISHPNVETRIRLTYP